MMDDATARARSTLIRCWTCDGLGLYTGNGEKCETCEGTAQIRVVRIHPTWTDEEMAARNGRLRAALEAHCIRLEGDWPWA
jgi:DnaJ-class molecular chaperone